LQSRGKEPEAKILLQKAVLEAEEIYGPEHEITKSLGIRSKMASWEMVVLYSMASWEMWASCRR
jgi:hypothetical protein